MEIFTSASYSEGSQFHVKIRLEHLLNLKMTVFGNVMSCLIDVYQ
jgi:cyclophilin family peptidyl-prolyl cis-trans isomerase